MAKLAHALIIETIGLGDRTAFVVTAQKCDVIRIVDFDTN